MTTGTETGGSDRIFAEPLLTPVRQIRRKLRRLTQAPKEARAFFSSSNTSKTV